MASHKIEPNTSWLPALCAAQEEHDLDLAAEVAIGEQNPIQETPNGMASSPVQTEDQERSIEQSSPPAKSFDMIEETRKFNASNVPLVSDPGGDTWIFIDPPPCSSSQDPNQYKAICDHFAVPHCFKSETLKGLNSPVFNHLLGPTPQFRVKRRRKLAGRLPANIEYVIDLTPQVEGDEGAHLLSQLMCPVGVRTWVLASSRWDIPAYLVGGDEDYSWLYPRSNRPGTTTLILQNPSCGLESDEIKVRRRAALVYDSLGNEIGINNVEQDYIIPASYTAIRHHCAIERVLNLLVDNDPKLNSAPKVWTTFVMAKYLGVANHVNLNNYIIRWLEAYRNKVFLEIMPELCLEIADGLQNFHLCRTAFATLVGERALESVQVEPTSLSSSKPKNSPSTIHGRKRYDIAEAYETRLEYAYVGFREMVFEEYTMLVKGNWIKDLPEYQRLLLSGNDDKAIQLKLLKLRCLLLEYVRGFIMFVLRAYPRAITGPDGDRPGNDEIFPTTPFATTWNVLSLRQRILTRSFWTLLGTQNLHKSKSNNQIGEKAQLCSNDFITTYLDGECNVQGSTLLDSVAAAVSSYCEKLEEFSRREELEKTGVLQAGQASKRTKEMDDGIVQSSENNPTSTTWNRTFNRFLSRCSRGQKTSTQLSTAPTHIPRQEVSSEEPTAKRPKIEREIDNEVQPHVRLAQGTMDLPFRPSPSTLKSVQKHVPMPVNDPPSSTGEGALWDQRELALASDRADQRLQPPPYNAYEHPPAPGLTPWTDFVDSDNLAVPAAESQAQENNGHTQARAYEANFFEDSNWLLPDYEHHGETSAPEYGRLPDDQGSEDDQMESSDGDYHNSVFNLEVFLRQANNHIHQVCKRMLSLPKDAKLSHREWSLNNCLECLTDNEWKYLPLWAGGNDDGSGGVFDDEIPIPDAQFTTAGPKVFSSGSSSAASSSGSFDMVSTGGSTRNTSTVVQDGFSDTLERHRTYAASEISDSPSTVGRLASQLGDYDMLSDVATEEHAGYEEGYAVPGIANEVADMIEKGANTTEMETKPSAVATGKASANPDESFDDVFEYESGGDDTEGEGEDQVFEED